MRVESRGFSQALGGLFSAMKTGSFFGADRIPWFDGNLFADPEVLPLEGPDIEVVRTAANVDWSSIEPSIFGTLFEHGLDPPSAASSGLTPPTQGPSCGSSVPWSRSPLFYTNKYMRLIETEMFS